jgi:hypothetical protein
VCNPYLILFAINFVFDIRSALETSLQIEKEWRASLQNNYEQEKEKVAQAQLELAQMNALVKVRPQPFSLVPVCVIQYTRGVMKDQCVMCHQLKFSECHCHIPYQRGSLFSERETSYLT